MKISNRLSAIRRRWMKQPPERALNTLPAHDTNYHSTLLAAGVVLLKLTRRIFKEASDGHETNIGMAPKKMPAPLHAYKLMCSKFSARFSHKLLWTIPVILECFKQ